MAGDIGLRIVKIEVMRSKAVKPCPVRCATLIRHLAQILYSRLAPSCQQSCQIVEKGPLGLGDEVIAP